MYYATKYGQATVVEALLKSASVEMIVSLYGLVFSVIPVHQPLLTASLANFSNLLLRVRALRYVEYLHTRSPMVVGMCIATHVFYKLSGQYSCHVCHCLHCTLQNRWGTLHTAARYGHVPVVDSLIKLGADVNIISMVNTMHTVCTGGSVCDVCYIGELDSFANSC